jgi:hypothetical protein
VQGGDGRLDLVRAGRCSCSTRSRIATPSSISSRRQIDRSCSASVRTVPSGPSRASRRACCCCLSYDGGDKANHMVPWLEFLMRTFSVPGATAEGVREMTCDHVLNGMVIGSRRDTRELYSITVRNNDVEVELLWPGNPQWSDYPRLAYQVEIDRVRKWVTDRRAREKRG